MFPFVSDKDKAKAAWDSLEAMFKSTSVNDGNTCGESQRDELGRPLIQGEYQTGECSNKDGSVQKKKKSNKDVSDRNVRDNPHGELLSACRDGYWVSARGIYDGLYRCPPETSKIPGIPSEEDKRAFAQIISYCFYSQEFDIAFDLLDRRPMLILAKDNSGNSPLYVLSTVRSAFLTGMPLNLWQKLIYHSIQIPPMEKDACYADQHIGDGQGINDIRKKKLVHVRTLEMLDIMCQATEHLTLEQLKEGITQQAIKAVEQGNVECVRKLCEANPKLLEISDGKGKSLFQFSIECRQEKVYCYLFELATNIIDRKLFESGEDKLGNSVLHSAASLSSVAVAQLNRIQGAALQLQSELQWFKEVENIVPLRIRNMVNKKDRMTARELFTKNHKEMVNEGEKQMKEIATSCTVVGALIVTMMFAAAFTVPGGTNGDTGMPIFLNKKWFRVFIFSDAISLLSSTTSIVIFLGILTSRYAENDFLKSLPRKMVFGLSTLFISIAAMMIAFVSALIIMLLGTPWIIITVVSLAIVPVTSFAWMQFPLLFEILISTFRRGRFHKKVKLPSNK